MPIDVTPHAPLCVMDFAIARDEDWYDPLPQVTFGGAPYNLNGCVLDVYIRPTFDHATLIKQISNTTGINFSDAGSGYCEIFLDRATVISDLPVGSWSIFGVLTLLVPLAGGANQIELWRGSLGVSAGKIT